jgi:hypothetical protein
MTMDNIAGMQSSKNRIIALRDLFLTSVRGEVLKAAESGATWNYAVWPTEDKARESVMRDLECAVFDAVEDITRGIDLSIDEEVGEITEDPAREHCTYDATSIYGRAAE